MREKAPTFLSQNYQAVVMKAMNESRGTTLPNFISPQLHSNLVASELRALQGHAEAVLNESRKLWDDVIGTFFSCNIPFSIFYLLFQERLCQEAFGVIPALSNSVRVSLEDMLGSQEVEAGNDISKSLKRELTSMPFTMNHYFIRYESGV